MWKIFFVYDDGSKTTITGKHKDIPLGLAVKYYNEYAAGHVMRRCEYQQYPKNKYPAMYLMDKIEQLEVEVLGNIFDNPDLLEEKHE